MKGYFISLEGGEGAGKSTVADCLNKQLTEQGYDCFVTREPGGVPISEQIRDVILADASEGMDGRTEVLLYAAARREHLVQKIIPALQSGKVVICDRFIDSSLAYQGYARGLGIDEVLQINNFSIEGMFPNMTLFFDLAPELGLQRIAANNERETNRFDAEHIEFHRRVYEGYQHVVSRFPERMHRLDASQSIDSVVKEAMTLVLTHIQANE